MSKLYGHEEQIGTSFDAVVLCDTIHDRVTVTRLSKVIQGYQLSL